MIARATQGLRNSYILPNQWRLMRVEDGFALLAPTTDNRYEPCGMFRHHISLFVSAFDALPDEDEDQEFDYGFDPCVIDTRAAFRNLPRCYELPRGWKLTKGERHFTLAPSNRLFALPSGIVTDCVAQFARDMGGRALVEEPRTKIYISDSSFRLAVG